MEIQVIGAAGAGKSTLLVLLLGEDIRMQRLYNREFAAFGARMLPMSRPLVNFCPGAKHTLRQTRTASVRLPSISAF